jgi:hypothetical protein
MDFFPSKLPVLPDCAAFAPTAIDIAGARAAAQRIGAAADYMNADALLGNLDVMREAGVMLTTRGDIACGPMRCSMDYGPACYAHDIGKSNLNHRLPEVG